MATVVHSDACCARQDAARRWQEDWPQFCRSCYGLGGHWDGGSYWQPPDYDYCETCLGQNVCPRCGTGAAFTVEDSEPP